MFVSLLSICTRKWMWRALSHVSRRPAYLATTVVRYWVLLYPMTRLLVSIPIRSGHVIGVKMRLLISNLINQLNRLNCSMWPLWQVDFQGLDINELLDITIWMSSLFGLHNHEDRRPMSRTKEVIHAIKNSSSSPIPECYLKCQMIMYSIHINTFLS
jgi:hypothetical protein